MSTSKFVTVISCNILISACLVSFVGLSHLLESRRAAEAVRAGQLLAAAVLAEKTAKSAPCLEDLRAL